MTTDLSTPLLDKINSPADLRRLSEAKLPLLAGEIREFLLRWASQNSGHFAASLGAVELTIALHYIYNTPEDRLIWDVGHQAYVHKILTGRRDRLHSIRKTGGLAPFPKREESEYDAFGVGHSSTSISVALGMAIANQRMGGNRKAVAIIGLNYKDKREDALRWLTELGNPYEQSLADGDGRLGIDLGVYGVPETFVIAKDGVIRYKHIGPISAEALDKKILPLIKEISL